MVEKLRHHQEVAEEAFADAEWSAGPESAIHTQAMSKSVIYKNAKAG